MGEEYNDGLDDPLRTEVQLDFSGGMVSNARPDVLPPSAYAYAQNCFPREGLRLSTRPGYEVQGASGMSGSQALFFLSFASGVQRIVAVDNSVVKTWDGSVWATESHTPANATISLAQSGELLWLADGTARLYTWDGTTWTQRTNLGAGTGGPTAGATLLCAAANRLLASGYAAAPDTIEIGPLLSVGTWSAATWGLRIGGDGEAIVGLVPMQDNIVAVLKATSVWLLNLDPAQLSASPSAADFSIRALSRGAGCVGARAWARVADDLHIWSDDGVLSISRMVADGQSFVTGDPISLPVQDLVDRVNPAAASTITGHAYGRHVFWSVPLDDATEPDTVLVWDTRLKVWVAVFTGWDALRLITARWQDEAPSLYWQKANGDLALWLDHDDPDLAATYLDNGAAFTTLITLRGFAFQDGLVTKNGDKVECRFRNSLAEQVTIRALYDEGLAKTVTRDTTQATVTLPFDLPVTLGVVAPRDLRFGLPMSPRFRQMQIQIETTGQVNFYEARATAWANPQD